jgi:glycosyltransferase involved in cell wall biosynthesis
MPTFSIITINLNNCKGLEKTIESVFSQTCRDFEYLIIDGGSTDGSWDLVQKWSGRLKYFVSEKDDGVYHAMNKGIQQATGNYLMFLNSGDYLLQPEVLSQSLAIISTHAADIYYGNVVMEKGGQKRTQKHGMPLTLEYLESAPINHQASFISRKLFSELGVYDVRFPMAADHAFNLKAFISGKEFKYLDLYIVNYDTDGMSMIHWDRYAEQMKEIYDCYVPSFLKRLQLENKEYKYILQHRIMRFAKTINDRYQALKRH